MKLTQPDNKLLLAGLVVITCIAWCSIFLDLGRLTLRFWDEAPYAVNARIMIEHPTLIQVTNYQGEPDLWNTKPVLPIWLMAASMKVFGINETGARFASAFFGLLTAVFIYLFSSLFARSKTAGFIAAVVLLSSYGYTDEHGARTGDFDTMMTFWNLVNACMFFAYTETVEQKMKNKLLLAGFAALILACMTKGIAAILPLPAIAAWLLLRRQLLPTLKSPLFYTGAAAFIVIVPGYYLLRERIGPGYLQSMYDIEIMARFRRLEFINETELPYFYYLQQMYVKGRFMPWLPLLGVSVILAARNYNGKERLHIFSLFVLLHAALITCSLASSATKAYWYDIPLYPAFVLCIGTGIAAEAKRYRNKYVPALVILLFMVISCFPLYKIVARNLYQPEDLHFRDFVTKLRHDHGYNKDLTVFGAEPDFSMLFYFMRDGELGYHDREIGVKEAAGLQPGDHIVVIKEAREADLREQYEMEELYRYRNCALLRVKTRSGPVN